MLISKLDEMETTLEECEKYLKTVRESSSKLRLHDYFSLSASLRRYLSKLGKLDSVFFDKTYKYYPDLNKRKKSLERDSLAMQSKILRTESHLLNNLF